MKTQKINYLLLDSDGVLYPTSQLSLRAISTALMRTIEGFGLNKNVWRMCSDYCKEHAYLGMLNKIKRLCDTNDLSEMDFYNAHAETIDYSSIAPNLELKKYLLELKCSG